MSLLMSIATLMKVLLLFAAVSLGVSASATLDYEWTAWKAQYGKMYEDEASESIRRLVWENNWRFVQQHNSEEHSFSLEMNEFADLVCCYVASYLYII